jgi:endonuclease YncB( thermonuclease family)
MRRTLIAVQLSAAAAALGAIVIALVASESSISVVDGDTIRKDRVKYRIVGYDAPETFRAQCLSEHVLGDRATARLQRLIDLGARLEPVACSCRPGTAGTSACNYGRSCGRMWFEGRDVAEIMIQEGLAHRYECTATRCPRRDGWC